MRIFFAGDDFVRDGHLAEKRVRDKDKITCPQKVRCRQLPQETDRFDQILFFFVGIPDDEKVIWDHAGMPIDNLCRAQDLGVCHRSFEGHFLRSIASALDSHAQALIEQWRLEYNTLRPHSSLNYRPPAPEAWLHGGHIF